MILKILDSTRNNISQLHTQLGTFQSLPVPSVKPVSVGSFPRHILSPSAEEFVPRSAPVVQDRSAGNYNDPVADNLLPSSIESDDNDELASEVISSQDEVLLQHFLSSDQSSSIPPNCSCHSLPIGSCPEIIQEFFKTVQSLRDLPNLPANMDSGF